MMPDSGLTSSKTNNSMNRILAPCIALCSLLAVIVQYVLMFSNSNHNAFETTIRFFSFFTILTNTLVAVYFSKLTYDWRRQKESMPVHFGTLTAITLYIIIVGLVYQVILRHLWEPTGVQRVVDEMLHSINPVLVLSYWLLNKKGKTLMYRQILSWLIFPLVYLVYVLIRGYYSGFFPYPFLDMRSLGFQRVIVNCIGMTFLFVAIGILLVWIANAKRKKEKWEMAR